MKIEMKNPLCYECCEKIDKLRKRVKGKAITVVTMGPYGTTSSISAEHFKNYLLEYLGAGSVHINLFDTFEQALEEVKRIQADFIVLPNAYGKMTNFYWDTTLDLVFSYTFKTPNYGITAMNSDYQKKESITISTCKAVEHLISEMLKELEIEENRVHIVEAYSTKKSLMMLGAC